MRRAFSTKAAFDEWHAQAKVALGLPWVGTNAATGAPEPHKQQLTGWAELDEDALTAEVAPTAHLGGVATLIRADLLTPEEMTAMAEAFPAWEPDEAVQAGELRSHGGRLYRCVQAHTTQAGWEPPATSALWVDTAPPDVIPEWRQPTGAHDAYQVGDRVTFDGSVYESLIDANTWSPTAYPQGWQLIE